MIDLYTFATPNGWKATVALEEPGPPYKLHTVDLSIGEPHGPEFLSLNPNGRIPVIVDRDEDNFAVFESGAILIPPLAGRADEQKARGASMVRGSCERLGCSNSTRG